MAVEHGAACAARGGRRRARGRERGAASAGAAGSPWEPGASDGMSTRLCGPERRLRAQRGVGPSGLSRGFGAHAEAARAWGAGCGSSKATGGDQEGAGARWGRGCAACGRLARRRQRRGRGGGARAQEPPCGRRPFTLSARVAFTQAPERRGRGPWARGALACCAAPGARPRAARRGAAQRGAAVPLLAAAMRARAWDSNARRHAGAAPWRPQRVAAPRARWPGLGPGARARAPRAPPRASRRLA
jgi:hypothetical protein